MTISSGEIKRNMTIILEDSVYQILDWQHRQAPKAPPTLTLKLRQLKTGKVFERKLAGSHRLSLAPTETKSCQYLYAEKDVFVFMDNGSFEQFDLRKEDFKNATDFIGEGDSVNIRFYEGEPLLVDIPPTVELEVTYTENGVKGDTQSAATKPATMNTGYTLQVPLFIKVGNKINVSTQNGEYIGRA